MISRRTGRHVGRRKWGTLRRAKRAVLTVTPGHAALPPDQVRTINPRLRDVEQIPRHALARLPEQVCPAFRADGSGSVWSVTVPPALYLLISSIRPPITQCGRLGRACPVGNIPMSQLAFRFSNAAGAQSIRLPMVAPRT